MLTYLLSIVPSMLAIVKLEELWNEVLEREGVALLCAYHLDEGDEAEAHFPDDLRLLHSHLVPVGAAG